MHILIYLAHRPGQVVSRGELLDAIWGQDTFVTDNTLSRTVARLRKALCDDWQKPSYLETISKSGYRFIADVNFDETRRASATELAQPTRGELSSTTWRKPSLIGAVAIGAVAAALTMWLLFRTTAPNPAPHLAPVPVVTLVGPQASQKLSPDGDRIVFSWAGLDGQNWDIYIKQMGAEDPLRITQTPEAERHPTWSADGSSIAYVVSDSERSGIFRIFALGGTPVLLARVSSQARDLSWSPDGQKIIFSDIPEGSSLFHLFELNLKTQGVRILTRPELADGGDSRAVFSPDGRTVAFRRREGRRDELRLLDIETLTERQLSQNDGSEIRGHDWSPDGKSLIYSSNRGGQFALWNLPVAGIAPTRLPINDQWITEPSVARHRNRLVYRKFSDVVNIWSVELNDESKPVGERVRCVPSTRTEFQPAISPDGKRLAFVSNRSGEFEIWSSELATGHLIQHSQLGGPIPSGPVWSPDSRYLVFDSAASGNGDLYIVEHNSRMARRLTDDSSDEFNASFSRDGQRLYFTSNRTGRWEIWSMPVEGGSAEQVTRNGGFYAQEDFQHKFLYFARISDSSFWRLPLDGGSEEPLGNMHPYDWAAWDLVERGGFLVLRFPHRIVFTSLPVIKGEFLQVESPRNTQPYAGRNISLTPDGRHLFYSEIETSDDEVMLVDF